MSGQRSWNRYRDYLSRPPEIVFEWHDAHTGARGWLVLNSLRGGAAGGGTRMRLGLTREEVTYLAKAMELKFAFSGPPIGGAKSGIDFDPRDPRKTGVLKRWFEAVRPMLAACYGTGGDVNVDEQQDVEPMVRGLGLSHPQEGILAGHFHRQGRSAMGALENLRKGLALPVEGSRWGVPGLPLTVADTITGWGVACAAARMFEADGGLEGVRVVVEGFGNVGGAAALYLARRGARIVALVDELGALVHHDGFDATGVEEILRRRVDGRELPPDARLRTGADRESAYATPAELFVPAAISGSVDPRRLDVLHESGVTTIVSGANHPFRELRLGDTRTQERADAEFRVLADIVSSLGMARAFDHLMEGGAADDPVFIFDAVEERVDRVAAAVLERCRSGRRGCLAAAIELALDATGFDGAMTHSAPPDHQR